MSKLEFRDKAHCILSPFQGQSVSLILVLIIWGTRCYPEDHVNASEIVIVVELPDGLFETDSWPLPQNPQCSESGAQ